MRTFCLVASLVSACTINNGDDDGENPDPGTPDGSGGGGTPDGSGGGMNVQPRSGAWGYQETSPVTNGCGSAPVEGEGPGNFALVNHGDGTFTIEPNDGTDPFDCSTALSDFSCPDRAYLDEDVSSTTTLTGTARAEGTFSDEENGTGSQQVTVTCDGPECGALAAGFGTSFPCHMSVSFRIEYLGL